jgi:hypothetical protein
MSFLMKIINLQQNKTKQNKTRRVQFQINRFKVYQHLPTINKSNGVFVIEIKD